MNRLCSYHDATESVFCSRNKARSRVSSNNFRHKLRILIFFWELSQANKQKSKTDEIVITLWSKYTCIKRIVTKICRLISPFCGSESLLQMKPNSTSCTLFLLFYSGRATKASVLAFEHLNLRLFRAVFVWMLTDNNWIEKENVCMNWLKEPFSISRSKYSCVNYENDKHICIVRVYDGKTSFCTQDQVLERIFMRCTRYAIQTTNDLYSMCVLYVHFALQERACVYVCVLFFFHILFFCFFSHSQLESAMSVIFF